MVVDGEARRGHPLPELTRERRAQRIDRARRERGEHEVVQEIGHRLLAEDDRVLAGRHALAVGRADRVLGGVHPRLVREVVEPCPRRPTRTLGVLGFHHRGEEAHDERRLVGLGAGHAGRRHRDPLLQDRHVAAEDEPEPREPRLAAGEGRELRRGHESPERAGDHPPARLDEIPVSQLEQAGIVVVPQRSRLAPGRGQGDELGIEDGALARLGERAPDALEREVAGLGAEPDPGAGGRREHHLEPQAKGLGRLGLLHAVGGDVRRVADAGEQAAVDGDEDLALADVRLGGQAFERGLGGLRELRRRDHLSVPAAGRPSCPRPDSPWPSSPRAPRRGRAGSATRARRGCCWPPGTARAGTFSRRRPTRCG